MNCFKNVNYVCSKKKNQKNDKQQPLFTFSYPFVAEILYCEERNFMLNMQVQKHLHEETSDHCIM